MSYLVLARKYRPMFFEDVMGQQHVTHTLQNAIQQNRIANAYLFAGPRGVGKTTVARLLAKALNCEQGASVHPCNVCSSCVEINESRSLDVFEIDGASNRGIDEVRNLRESLHYAPHPGKHRIYIIDEVHMLTNEAFNALLKTLEEPPSKVLFIFATTEAHKVPATILSRCQRFDFKRMPHTAIVAQLKHLCQQEGITIDDESLRLIALKADGSMRDSQSILDQIIAFSGLTIHSKDTAALLGIIDQDLFFKYTDLVHTGDVPNGLNLIRHIYTEGYDFSEFLTGLQEHLRNFMIVQAAGTAELLDVSEEHAARYLQQKDHFSLEDLLRLARTAAETDQLLRRSSNARLHFEMAMVKMIKMSCSVQLSELMQQLQNVKKNSNPAIAAPAAPSRPPAAVLSSEKSTPPLAPEPVSVPVEKPASPPAAAPSPEVKITLPELESRWEEITLTVKKRKIALGSLLNEGWPVRIRGHQLEIAFAPENGFHLSAIENSRKEVEDLLQEIVGERFRIVCVKDEAGVLKQVRKTPATTDKKSELEKLAQANEQVKKIIDTFDAEFIK
jgi:DNA polymerase III subunit gamma/tau